VTIGKNERWPTTLDATYFFNGYVERTTDTRYMAWLVNLGPANSTWGAAVWLGGIWLTRN